MRKQATKSNHEIVVNIFAKYGKNREGFVEEDQNLGGEIVMHGDASVQDVPGSICWASQTPFTPTY
jgi:hypothetical protein